MTTSPVEVYLSKWPASSDTRATMRAALDALAGVISPGATADTYPWHELRYETVRAIPARLVDSGRARATVNKYLSALRGVLEASWRLGLLPDEEYRKIEVKSVRGKRLPAGRALSDQDVEALSKEIEELPPRDAALIAYLLVFGLRRVEVYKDATTYMRREDYDPEAAVILARGKGGKERAIPAAEEWLKTIESWWRTLPEGSPMFPCEDGTPVTRRQLSYVVKKFCDGSESVRRFTPHDLRRTFATGLLANGVDLLLVKDLMGHSSLDTTSIYDRRGDAAKRAAVNTIKKPGSGT